MIGREKKQPASDRRSSQKTSVNTVPTFFYRHSRSEREGLTGRNIVNASAPVPQRSPKSIRLEKFGLVFIALILIFLLISTLYLSSSADIKIVGGRPSAIFISPEAAVKLRADKLLSSSILSIDKVTVNTANIRSTIEEEFPMYSNVIITMPLISHHLVINLTPAVPTFLLSNSSGSYLLSASGQIMISSRATNTFNYLNLPVIKYQVASFLNSGDKILTTNEVQFIQIVVYELHAKGFGLASMTLPEGTSELDVYIAKEPYFVKFNLQNNDPRQQAGSFLAAQHYLSGQGITPSQYIDARVDGRIYYQ